MFFGFFANNAPALDSVGVCRLIHMGFVAFFSGKKSTFQLIKTNLKIVAALRLVREFARKFLKSEKMGAKFVHTTSTI